MITWPISLHLSTSFLLVHGHKFIIGWPYLVLGFKFLSRFSKQTHLMSILFESYLNPSLRRLYDEINPLTNHTVQRGALWLPNSPLYID